MNFRLFACGDVVNHTAREDFIDSNLKSVIEKSDIAICNFEAPIKTKNMKAIRKAGPHIFQSKKSIQYLKETGFDFVALANNHIYDYGQDAFENTINELKKYDIGYVGADINFSNAYKTKIIEKNSIKLGLLAGGENGFGCLYENKDRGGYAWILHNCLDDNIRNLRQKCDFVVLISHAGVENINIPIKEWRDIYKRFCDIGVDVVIGHHPHVPQGYESYNDSLIFYSLGNFYFDTVQFVNKSDDSYSVLLNLNKNKKITFEIIYHKKVNGQTCKVSQKDVNFNLDYLNSLLFDNYENLNNDTSINLFNSYYYNYYKQALSSSLLSFNLKKKLKLIIIKWLFPKKYQKYQKNNGLLLLHNIKIDSHRFTVQRALSLIYEEE